MTIESAPRTDAEAVGATLVQAKRYRSLKYVSQPLGPFHVLVGSNASGKSNFLDVLAFLSDMLKTDLHTAMLGDARFDVPLRATSGRDLVWRKQRGSDGDSDHSFGIDAANDLSEDHPGGSEQDSDYSFELAVEMAIPTLVNPEDHGIPLLEGECLDEMAIPEQYRSGGSTCRYEIKIDVSGEPRIVAESIWLKPCAAPQSGSNTVVRAPNHPPKGWRNVVSRGSTPREVYYRSEKSDWKARFRIDSHRSALANLIEDYSLFPVALWFKHKLLDTHRIVLSGEAMRRPCPPIHRYSDFLPDGSNLPHLVQRLADSSPELYPMWIRHVREDLPDILDITTRERPEDLFRYLVVKFANGIELPSWLVSDGALRLMALTLLAYLPDRSGIYLIEEPENGLRPLAIQTVFQSLSSVYDGQVLLTTHSPAVVRLAQTDQLLCLNQDELEGTQVCAGTNHPLLKDWQGTADPGTLWASGILG